MRQGASVGSPEFAAALEAARKAVELQPDLGLARDVLGRLYLQQGNIDEAIKQSRLAFRDDPNDQAALYHLILALKKGGKSDEVPELMKRLTALREDARTKEIRERQYAIVEKKP
jgi:tetratricopeptide (TPR) repeat protein